MRQTVLGSQETGIRYTTDSKILEDLDFTDYLCLISHKIEDLQANINKLAGEVDSEHGTPGGHREDASDNQPPPPPPTATTTRINHHQRERFDRVYFLPSLIWPGSTISTTGSQN
uniref:Uncharacterized protein n=1 Tax=Trichobilharzia regenti TaxID=157069 RepID=A0AA85JBV8_TRIRE|nr:unnamed protein product [Trichobilharzia regenti]